MATLVIFVFASILMAACGPKRAYPPGCQGCPKVRICRPMPPQVVPRQIGCKIEQKPEPDGHYYVRGVVTDPEGKMWYGFVSARMPDELMKAMEDCHGWMRCAREYYRAQGR